MTSTFTMAAPGEIFPRPSAQPDVPPAPLWKTRRDWTSLSVYEVVEAVTTDGEWMCELADDGTWTVGHLPTKTVVKPRLRSRGASRAYVASGKARADLDRIQAEAATKGEANG